MATTKLHSSAARVLPQHSVSLRELMIATKKLHHIYMIETDVQDIPVTLRNIIDHRSWELDKKYYKNISHRAAWTKNTKAKDVTLAKLKKFFNSVEMRSYRQGSFMCMDIATLVHNTSEAAGIRCGVVLIKYKNKRHGHALNVFNTTDHGLIFYGGEHSEYMSEYNFFNQGKRFRRDDETKPVITGAFLQYYFDTGLRSVEILW